ncbi:ATP-binding protein [Flavobacteriales bacterium]|nr:ATP-binding protein [Flavobacteriales bacterium]
MTTLIERTKMDNTLIQKTIQLDSTQESINKVTAYIDEIYSAQSDILNDAYGNIIIAMTEAVNNAINHGNKNIPEKKVTVGYSQTDTKVSFTIEDEGNGFDYENVPDPTDPANLEKLNGRGIFLMTNLADDIHFHEEGKRIELIFNLA